MLQISTLVVGGGPAALAFLLAARRAGTLPALLGAGLRVIERSATFGTGDIGQYAIRSDSHVDSFIDAAKDDALQLRSDVYRRLEQQRGASADLSDTGEFLSDLGKLMRRDLASQGYDPVLQGTEVLRVSRHPTGGWRAICKEVSTDRQFHLHSQCVVIATGGLSSEQAIKAASVGSLPLWPRYNDKILSAAEFLSHPFRRQLDRSERRYKRIAIIGGSHSALASANEILKDFDPAFRGSEVCVLHRSPLRITYHSPAAAVAEGYDQFSDQDICPKTGRVFPLAGFRSESRDLVRAQWSLGGMQPNPRLRLVNTHDVDSKMTAAMLDDCDLIIAALGFWSRGLEVRDENGQAIPLSGTRPQSPLVNGVSEVLDAGGAVVDRLYGIGMAAGYPLAGVHGEPSFHGQAKSRCSHVVP